MYFKILNDRNCFYQWDRNQKMIVENDGITELHFSVSGQDHAYCMPVYEENSMRVCGVPNVLLESHGNLTVYGWIDEYTRTHYVYRIIERKMPNDFVPTSDIEKWSELEERIEDLEEKGVNEEQIAKAVNDYLTNNPVESGSSAKISEVTLLSSGWVGTASPYSQEVNIEGATENSQVDLTPSVEQLAIFYEKDLAFVTENVNGTVTVFAIGQKPQNDYTIQVTLTEVLYD